MEIFCGNLCIDLCQGYHNVIYEILVCVCECVYGLAMVVVFGAMAFVFVSCRTDRPMWHIVRVRRVVGVPYGQSSVRIHISNMHLLVLHNFQHKCFLTYFTVAGPSASQVCVQPAEHDRNHQAGTLAAPGFAVCLRSSLIEVPASILCRAQ